MPDRYGKRGHYIYDPAAFELANKAIDTLANNKPIGENALHGLLVQHSNGVSMNVLVELRHRIMNNHDGHQSNSDLQEALNRLVEQGDAARIRILNAAEDSARAASSVYIPPVR